MSHATSDNSHFFLFRAAAIALAALVGVDNFVFGGEYTDHVQALTRSLSHFIIG
jgi:hypothetical protein